MFNSSKVENEKKFMGKYITVGVQELKINSIEVKSSAAGTSKQVTFNVEGQEVKDLGFEGDNGAKGQVGKISTSYLKPEKESEITTIFARIADAIGTRDQLNAIQSDSLESYVEAANKVLTGKFANFAVGGEEYIKQGNGKVGIGLRFPKFNFVEKIGTIPSTVKFDKSNAYHYKTAVQPDNIGTMDMPTSQKMDDSQLPF